MAKRSRRRRRHDIVPRRSLPGASPGTVTVDPSAPAPRIRVIAYRADDCVDRALDDLNELPRLLEEWSVVWLDVAGLGDADTISEIGRVLGLHELSLEDVVNVHQRPKVEEYDEYGYPFAMGLMAAIAVALLILFRVRGWLRADDLRPRRGRERP